MQINFIGILIRPFTFKNLTMFVLKLILLFLPTILLFYFMGSANWIFWTLLSTALIISNGYLWIILQNEAELDIDILPKWKFIDTFFIGLKGLFLSLFYSAVLFIILLMLRFIDYHLTNATNIIITIGAFVIIIWYFAIYPVAVGIFSEKYSIGEALDYFNIIQIIFACWLNYLIAFLYISAYIFIIGMITWICLILFGQWFNIFIILPFALYIIILYFLLYANVFKSIREEFESHI